MAEIENEAFPAWADCYNSALRLLGYRPRSEGELRQRLLRRFPPEAVEMVLAKLKELKLVDDAAFAHFWREGREGTRPRSAFLLRQELRQKGVAEETIALALSGLDEEDSAYRAAAKLARRCASLDYGEFRRKVGSLLRRRGFGWETARRAVDHLWREGRAGRQ